MKFKPGDQITIRKRLNLFPMVNLYDPCSQIEIVGIGKDQVGNVLYICRGPEGLAGHDGYVSSMEMLAGEKPSLDSGSKRYWFVDVNKLDEALNDPEEPNRTKRDLGRTNEDVRARSGTVTGSDRLTAFLYLLMRDEVTPGRVEKLVTELAEKHGPYTYTVGWMARYAEDLARDLRGEFDQ